MNANISDGRSAEKNNANALPSCECFPGGDMTGHPFNFRKFLSYGVLVFSSGGFFFYVAKSHVERMATCPNLVNPRARVGAK